MGLFGWEGRLKRQGVGGDGLFRQTVGVSGRTTDFDLQGCGGEGNLAVSQTLDWIEEEWSGLTGDEDLLDAGLSSADIDRVLQTGGAVNLEG